MCSAGVENLIWHNVYCLSGQGMESNGNMEYIRHKRQTTVIPKTLSSRHAISFTLNPISSINSILSIRTVPRVRSEIQVSFQPFTENKGSPCSRRFLGPAAGYGWPAAGGKPWGEEEDYWKPWGRLANLLGSGEDTPAQSCPTQIKPTLSNVSGCFLHAVLDLQNCFQPCFFFFLSPNDSVGHACALVCFEGLHPLPYDFNVPIKALY